MANPEVYSFEELEAKLNSSNQSETQTTQDPDLKDFGFKERSPSSRFEEDLVNYKPGLILTDPRHVDYFEFDTTPNLQRLEKMTDGGGGIADSFEQYVSKSFASAYNRFDDDPVLRKIKNDTAFGQTPSYKSRYSKSGYTDDDQGFLDMDEGLSSETLADLHRECKNELDKRSDFTVYQPKSLRHSDCQSAVTIRDVRRFERDLSPIDLEGNVREYKYGMAKAASGEKSRSSDRFHRVPTARQVIIDTSKYHRRNDLPGYEAALSYPARNEFLRKDDSMYVGGNFVMLTLRRDDRWNDKVDKLLEEARNT